jgi:hypothetical protein
LIGSLACSDLNLTGHRSGSCGVESVESITEIGLVVQSREKREETERRLCLGSIRFYFAVMRLRFGITCLHSVTTHVHYHWQLDTRAATADTYTYTPPLPLSFLCLSPLKWSVTAQRRRRRRMPIPGRPKIQMGHPRLHRRYRPPPMTPQPPARAPTPVWQHAVPNTPFMLSIRYTVR